MRLRLLLVSIVTALLSVLAFEVPRSLCLQSEIDANDRSILAAERLIDLRAKRARVALPGGSLSLQDPDGRLIDVEFSPLLTGTIFAENAIHVGSSRDGCVTLTGVDSTPLRFGDPDSIGWSGEIRLSGGTSR